jgi:hypothetical protein
MNLTYVPLKNNKTKTKSTGMRRTKINPPIQLLQKYEPNHAIFKTLWGPGLVELFDVYRLSIIPQSHTKDDVQNPHKNKVDTITTDNKREQNDEIIQVEIKLGSRLNGQGTGRFTTRQKGDVCSCQFEC